MLTVLLSLLFCIILFCILPLLSPIFVPYISKDPLHCKLPWVANTYMSPSPLSFLLYPSPSLSPPSIPSRKGRGGVAGKVYHVLLTCFASHKGEDKFLRVIVSRGRGAKEREGKRGGIEGGGREGGWRKRKKGN